MPCMRNLLLLISATTIVGPGFIALAAMIFGKWNPIGAMLSSLFFGLSQALAVVSTQIPFLAHIPGVYLRIAPYVLTIIVLAAFFGKSVAPKADGVNYIKSNYSQPMRVQDIAAGLGLNRSYFCRLFRQQTGLSPQEYIVSCRLAKAAQFMTEHGMSQEEAARQAGYPDVFSFSRMFRRKYGMPPGRYAARARQKQGG